MKQSIADIKSKLEKLPLEELSVALGEYDIDERAGVKTVIASFRRKLALYDKEIKRLEEMRFFERKYDFRDYIAGIDEVGRGPFSGPVVTAAVILPKNFAPLYINDSKKLSEQKREELYKVIMKNAIAIGIGIVHADVIDEINILQATYRAMQQAISNLSVVPDQILVDAVTIPGISIPQVGIIKGDEKSVSIAAASIIAKVTRDRMMVSYDLLYPGYQFGKNKGYGTGEHIQALQELGACPIHRRTFIKNFVN